ncbi:Vitamin B12 import ATP-binding protein BtuD [Eubacterium plexicaudatum ASF492]|uniref:ABC transporter domain-containing protein n=1 Tax=Eubacterium plexicaudatum ASF492 TaxID=1235802 RepID=N2A168_9FIRM|nr:Vitamin B12 import ATP-binding protein BtuD [Eubacterium plexicaudatum ASF492]
MNSNALTVSGLTKKYEAFTLSDISFEVPRGTIAGLIGENGAGKSTILKSVLGLIHKDQGEISVLGSPVEELQPKIRENIGVVFDGTNFSEELTPKKLHKVLKGIYGSWDEEYFFALLKKLSLPAEKKIKSFSKGMKAKLSYDYCDADLFICGKYGNGVACRKTIVKNGGILEREVIDTKGLSKSGIFQRYWISI